MFYIELYNKVIQNIYVFGYCDDCCLHYIYIQWILNS